MVPSGPERIGLGLVLWIPIRLRIVFTRRRIRLLMHPQGQDNRFVVCLSVVHGRLAPLEKKIVSFLDISAKIPLAYAARRGLVGFPRPTARTGGA
jgi:hypothetical protein